jgi:hypothetical protein
MKKSALFAALVGLVCLVGSTASFAQVKGIYWTTSGMFGPFDIRGLIPRFRRTNPARSPSRSACG